MIYKFGEQLIPVNMEEWEAEQVPAVFVTDSRHADAVLRNKFRQYLSRIQGMQTPSWRRQGSSLKMRSR